jgi:hypothetical protein
MTLPSLLYGVQQPKADLLRRCFLCAPSKSVASSENEALSFATLAKCFAHRFKQLLPRGIF